LRNKEGKQVKYGPKGDATADKIDKDPIIPKPPKHRKTLRLLRRLEEHLPSSIALLLRTVVLSAQEEENTERIAYKDNRATNLSSVRLHALEPDHPSRLRA
jgi:hypothetical protein